MEEIEFTIAKDGTVEYTIKGVKGESCENLSKVFEKLGKVTASKKTSEYYEKEVEAKTLTKQRK